LGLTNRSSLTNPETGYAPSLPRWQDSLQQAEEMAFPTLDNAINWLVEIERERAAEAQRGPRRALDLGE
jgi:hypothetical protein